MPLVFAASGGMGKAATDLLQAASKTSCTEVTPALQHHYGMASHSTELRPPAISSPCAFGDVEPGDHHLAVTSDHALDLMVSEGHLCH